MSPRPPLGQASSTGFDRCRTDLADCGDGAVRPFTVFARLPGDSGPWLQLLVAALLAIGAGFWFTAHRGLLAVYRWGARLANPLSLTARCPATRLAAPVAAVSFMSTPTALAVWILAGTGARDNLLTVLALCRRRSCSWSCRSPCRLGRA